MAADRVSWFLNDQAIRDVSKDAFGHDNVAEQIVGAATELECPVTVGLIGGFGTGKTTIAHLAMERIKNAHSKDFDAVRVTIDRHSGSARARSLVHAVGSELKAQKKISEAELNDALRPLRSAITISSDAPQESPLWNALNDPKSRRRILLPLGVVVLFAVVAVLGFLWRGQTVSDALNSVALLGTASGLVWLLDKVYRPWILDLFKSARVEDSTPRAEASDDVERIFEKVVKAHAKKSKRRLIVFVDDVDRLDPDDVLEALRSIKTLQAVPRGNEPVFVIACDDQVVALAIEMANEAPAPLAGTEDSLATRKSDAARALLDKFFSIRILLPPHLPGDMREFARTVVPAAHPARTMLGDKFENCLAILMHDIDDPRSVIRRLNYYFSALSLAQAREDSANAAKQRVQKGDITNHPELLARLIILRVEFPSFYEAVCGEHSLLEAASRLLLSEHLNPVQVDVLQRSRFVTLRKTSADPDEPVYPDQEDANSQIDQTQLEWSKGYLELRRYLLSTAHRVRVYPSSLTPLIHMSHSEAGRLAGNQRLASVIDAVRDGDRERVAAALEGSPTDLHRALAEAIAELVGDARPVDGPGVLVGAAAAGERLTDGRDVVCNAAARLLLDHNTVRARPQDVIVFLDHADPAMHDGLRSALVASRQDATPTERDEQMKIAATYAITRPGSEVIRAEVETYLRVVADIAGWAQGREWLAIAESAATAGHQHLLGVHLVPALVRLAARDPSVTEEEANRVLALVQSDQIEIEPALAQDAARLTDGTNTVLNRLMILLLSVVGEPLTIEPVRLITQALHHQLPADAATTAINLLAAMPAIWATESLASAAESPEPQELAPHVVAGVTGQFTTHRPSLSQATAAFLTRTVNHIAAHATVLATAMVAAVTEPDEAEDHGVLRIALTTVLDQLAEPDATAAGNALLAALNDSNAPLAGQPQRAVDSITLLGQTSAGRAAIDRAAANWRNSLASSPEHAEIPLTAFARTREVAPEILQTHAPHVITQVEAAFGQPTPKPAAQMKIVSRFPWPDAQLPQAVKLLEAHWAEVPEGDQLMALHHTATASDLGTTAPAVLREAMCAAAQASPESSALPDAIRVWNDLSAAQRRAILLVGATHPAGVAHLANVTDDDLVNLIYDAAHTGDPGPILGVIPTDRLQHAAREAILQRISSGHPYSLDASRSVVRAFEPETSEASFAAAKQAVTERSGDLIAAVRTLTAIDREGGGLPNSEVEDLVVDLLTSDLTNDLASALRQLLGVRGIPPKIDRQLGTINKEAKEQVGFFRSTKP